MKQFVDDGLEEQEKIKTHFQTYSKYWKNIYARDNVSAEIYRTRQATVLDWIDNLNLESGSRVLEIGCGAGFVSTALAQRGFRVNAIDLSEAMINMTRQHATDIGVANLLSADLGDIYSLAFEDGSFDLVVAIGVIPWLERPEIAMQEVARVTRQGGYAIITTTNRAGLISFLDPWINPMLRPLQLGLKKALKSVGLYHGSPGVTYHACRYIDKSLASLKLDKVRGKTLGFGPFSLFNRTVIPKVIGKALHVKLQRLADRNVPGFRTTGKHYIVLTRKSAR